jgi:agmatine deiminase
VLWLEGEIVGDDTDGHVDQLARFVGPRTVVAAAEEDPHDENFEPLQDNLRRLEQMTEEQGRPLQIVPLPMPRPVYHQGTRLPAGYVNFYIANGAVIVPQYDDPADARALEILASVFPGRQAIGLPATDLVWGLGAYHCITQQEPAASR